jgi:hypothetical protein
MASVAAVEKQIINDTSGKIPDKQINKNKNK